MNAEKNNTPRRIHNPKSHQPAVYIPCWLIQIASNLISHQAKILYGRLSQWSNARGIVYRSVKQLSQEIGSSERCIERTLKELRDLGLIGTYQPQSGGLNHFEFYDHPWMYDQIKEELCFKSEENLSTIPDIPPDKSGGTPPTKVADINIKEIKENNKYIYGMSPPVDNFHFEDYYEREEQKKLADESFDIFYSNYPRQKGENRARAAWFSQKCYQIFEEIMKSLFNQVTNDDEFKTGYAPSADKYILEERWKDKPIKRKKSESNQTLDRSDDSWAKNLHLDIL